MMWCGWIIESVAAMHTARTVLADGQKRHLHTQQLVRNAFHSTPTPGSILCCHSATQCGAGQRRERQVYSAHDTPGEFSHSECSSDKNSHRESLKSGSNCKQTSENKTTLGNTPNSQLSGSGGPEREGYQDGLGGDPGARCDGARQMGDILI